MVLEGRYRLDFVVSRGGMGVVFGATDLVRDEPVALKILSGEVWGDSSIRARARREGALIARVEHPNIVRLRRAGTTIEDVPFLVMEYLDGRSLRQMMEAQSPLGMARIVDILRQVTAGVGAVHEAGLLHRDVKPDNVVLVLDPLRRGQDLVKIVDFGIAGELGEGGRDRRRLTHPGVLLGSPRYMAPEQLFGDPVDVRTDLWAIGALAFEMLTGKIPLDGLTLNEILRKKAMESVPRVVDVGHGHGCPPALEAVVLCCLEREPDLRYSSADELGLALERVAEQLSARARREAV
ncbi:serine/threonine protein kinase [Myxococcota bacterium]|nr:serine/threonine protein kinase [Myxococcota bacterium]